MAMKRRASAQTATLATMASVGWRQAFGGRAAKPNRIGCTTFSFRMRFPATRREGVIASPPDLDLADMPALSVERLEVRHVEVWSEHVPEPTVSYAERLHAIADHAGARIVSIQHDEQPFDLSRAEADRRRACIEATRRWRDIAAACRSAHVGGPPGPRGLTDSIRLSAGPRTTCHWTRPAPSGALPTPSGIICSRPNGKERH